MKHPDREWINKRTGSHGACYTLRRNKSSFIDYIGGKPFIYVWYLNVVLYFRWLKRRTKKWFMRNIVIGKREQR